MPIIGKINSMPYENSVESMKVGGTGYLHIDDIVVTKKAVFIDLISRVKTFKEIKKFENIADYIPIKRIGEGLTEDDFEVNFLNSDNCSSILEPEDIYLELMEESEFYLVFFDFKIGKNSQNKISNLPSVISISSINNIDQLKKDLKIALENQDFEKAAIIRDTIVLMEKNRQ